MAIFSHIEHISHKWPMKVKFSHIEHISHKWSMKVIFHTNSYIFTHWAYFTQLFCYFPLQSWFFEILDFFMAVVAQVWSFVGWWYSWLDHRDDKRRNLIKLIKLFLIDEILDSDDLSFSRYNHLKSFCLLCLKHRTLKRGVLLTRRALTYISDGKCQR
jgi:hypothetical protein